MSALARQFWPNLPNNNTTNWNIKKELTQKVSSFSLCVQHLFDVQCHLLSKLTGFFTGNNSKVLSAVGKDDST